MAKKTTKKKVSTKKMAAAVPPESTTVRKQFSFPSKVRCPRCKTVNSLVRRTDVNAGIQYRVCQRATCRRRFSVHGTVV